MSEKKIDIRYIGSIKDEKSEEAKAIKRILIACDNDFIPTLSCREGTSANIGSQQLHEHGITPYLTQVLAQENIVAVNAANEIVAFMSFKNHYPHSENFPGVAEKCDVISYISTICVLCEYRRFGIARRFYELVETKLPQNINCVSTRTWSTNNSHIRLLEKRGYALTRTIFNDRVTDTGEKLDTVYFCKRVKF